MDEPINVTAIAVGAMGVIGTIASWIVNRKPQQADYASKLLDATVPAYETLSKRLAAVETQNAECQKRSEHLERKCERMLAYLASVGLEIPAELGDIEGEQAQR
jgi:hypothetical protein